jgi:hypothetical protein
MSLFLGINTVQFVTVTHQKLNIYDKRSPTKAPTKGPMKAPTKGPTKGPMKGLTKGLIKGQIKGPTFFLKICG